MVQRLALQILTLSITVRIGMPQQEMIFAKNLAWHLHILRHSVMASTENFDFSRCRSNRHASTKIIKNF